MLKLEMILVEIVHGIKTHMKTIFGLMATIFLGFTLAGLMIASEFYAIPCTIGIISLAVQFALRNE